MKTKKMIDVLILTASLLVLSLTAKAQSLTSPDGKWTVFVKPVSGDSIGTGLDDYKPSELWQVDSNGRHPTLLVRCHGSFDNDMSTVVAQFNELRFSPDGRLVYFETPAWATSGALHVVDTTNGREHFICAGGIESFRGNNLVVVETAYTRQGHQYQGFYSLPMAGRFLRCPNLLASDKYNCDKLPGGGVRT
jgi:hypothetical protein